MSRIFITGATGFIGGEVLHGLASNSSLAANMVALVRSEARAAQLTAKYPSVEPLIADLDASDAIASAASQADVILHLASSNHVGSAEAIAKGLGKSQRKNPVWIQISGASVLSGPEVANHSYGNASSRVYSDVEDIAELHSIVASSPKRVVDRIVTNLATSQPSVRTAIIYGPTIYGLGAGPVNRRSIQIPSLARATLRNGYAPHVGKGLSTWSNVHVSDIAKLILKLVAASRESSGSESKPLWNKDGVYFADAGKISFGEIARKIAAVAADKGFIASPEVREVDADAAESITAHAAVLLGTNAQTKADRARTWLGWEPQGPSLEAEIERAVLEEAASSARPNI